ncbi:GntR family transcriptional regulator, partial [Listeria seeligeri FSL N1-067]
ENIFLAAPTSMIDWSKSIDSVEDYQAILPHSKEVQDFQQILTVYTKDAC